MLRILMGALLLVVGTPIALRIAVKVADPPPAVLGISGGQLAVCPGTPNCVSSYSTRK